jgi:uncharacterized protein YjbI with pentapeptide repeats
MTTTHKVSFPSVHPSGGVAFRAEADAPTEALAVRAVLEACASQGVPLEYVVLRGISGLAGARLDGLKLTGCNLEQVDLSGASLTGARFESCKLRSVIADRATLLDGARLESVEFDGCKLDGLSAKGLQADALRFEFTSATGLDIPDARIHGLKVVRSNLTGWKSPMTQIIWCGDLAEIIDSADLTVNQKAAMRALAQPNATRASVQAYFDALEAQDAAAAQA